MKAIDEDPMEAQPPFKFIPCESSSEDVPLFSHAYMTPFLDHKDGEGIILNPKSKESVDKA